MHSECGSGTRGRRSSSAAARIGFSRGRDIHGTVGIDVTVTTATSIVLAAGSRRRWVRSCAKSALDGPRFAVLLRRIIAAGRSGTLGACLRNARDKAKATAQAKLERAPRNGGGATGCSVLFSANKIGRCTHVGSCARKFQKRLCNGMH